MTQEITIGDLASRKQGLLKDQVRLVKRKDCDRYEIARIQDNLSFEKGFFVVIRACQLLTQKNEGIVLVGLAGPSVPGRPRFPRKYSTLCQMLRSFRWIIIMMTDYDTLLKNINDLKEGKSVEVPIYDFKSSYRTGYRTLEVPGSRIVIIEGIYALSEKLRPLLIFEYLDIQRVGQEPEEIIYQISETVYPMYKAFIEPDLKTAHIRIVNKLTPSRIPESDLYSKSSRNLTVDQVRSVMSDEHTQTLEETYDIYLLPLAKIRKRANRI
ncbi:putative uridine kinase [Helianthus annuus]|nr:putative uridine kinase [Helianthus annuus]